MRVDKRKIDAMVARYLRQDVEQLSRADRVNPVR